MASQTISPPAASPQQAASPPATSSQAASQQASSPPPAGGPAAPQANPAIVFDPNVVGDLEDDDVLGSDIGSLRDSTTSLTASIFEYRTIHGRAYQSSKTTEYWAPTDDKHLDALDILHQVILMLMGNKLFLAPISSNPQKILDVGTGTGIWAIDVADEHPSASVIGTDISPCQPTWVPPNCSFQIDDAQQDWTFSPEGSFDLIHFRQLLGAIDDWSKLYAQAFTHIKPGGWLEHTDIDLETRSENPRVAADPDHIYKTWCQLYWDAGDKLGKTLRIARDGRMEDLAREAGFVDIVHKSWKVPIGGWAADPNLKRIGQLNGLFIDQSLDGFAIYLLAQVLGWTFNEVDVLIAQMRKVLRDPKTLPYYVIHTVYARKPE